MLKRSGRNILINYYQAESYKTHYLTNACATDGIRSKRFYKYKPVKWHWHLIYAVTFLICKYLYIATIFWRY